MFVYFKRAALFFDVKARIIPPVVFVILLVFFPLQSYFTSGDLELWDRYRTQLEQYVTREFAGANTAGFPNAPYETLSGLLTTTLVFWLLQEIVTSAYMCALIFDAKKIEYTAKDCIVTVLRRIFPIIFLSLLCLLVCVLGLMLLIIPGIILFIILIFSKCAVLDEGSGVLGSMRFSAFLTKGRRMDIFLVTLFATLFMMICQTLLLIIFSPTSNYVFNYVSIFLSVIMSMIHCKLIAVLYIDAHIESMGSHIGSDTADATGSPGTCGHDAGSSGAGSPDAGNSDASKQDPGK
jgi:hypothetical protein